MRDKEKSKAQLLEELTELRRRVAELESSASDLERTEDELLEKEYYRSFLESLTDWAWEMDAQGIHTYSNAAVEEILGYTVDEIVGNHVTELWPDDVKTPDTFESFQKTLASGKGWTDFQGYFKRKDGSRVITESTALPIFDSAGNLKGYRGLDRDITERFRLKMLHRIQRDLGIAVSATSNLKEALDHVMDAILHIETIDAGCVYLIDDSTKELNLVSQRGLPLDMTKKGARFDADSPLSRLAMRRTPSYGLFSAFFPKLASVRQHRSLRASASIPVNFKDTVVAVLFFSSFTRDEIPVNDRNALESIAAHIGGVIARVKAEEALRKSQERYALTTKASNVGVWDWNLETDEIYVDPTLKSLLGYEDHEIKNHLDDWGKLVHPDDTDRVMKEAQAHLAGSKPHYEVAHRMIHRDGSIRWFLARGTAMRGPDGKPYRVVGTDTDITDGKLAEKALQESEEKYRKIFEVSPEAIVLLDKTGNILDVNSRLHDWLGYSPEDVIGKNILDLAYLPPESKAKAMEKLAQRMAGKPLSPYELDFLTREGERCIGLIIAAPIRDKEGAIVQDLVMISNITDPKKAEEEIKRVHSDLNQIFNASVPLCVIAKDFTMLRVNDTYCSRFNERREEIIGQKCRELWFSPLCENSQCPMKHILNGEERYEYEWEEGNDDCTSAIFKVTAVPYRGTDGEIIGIIENFTDITRLRRAEEALRQAHDELEVRVEERTAELARTNEELQTEVADRIRAEEALRRRNCDLDSLNRASRSLAASLDLDNVIQTTLEEACHLLDASVCSIWFIDTDTKELICRQALGTLGKGVIGRRLSPGEGLAGWVAQHGESLVVPDKGEDDRGFEDVDGSAVFHSGMGVPLRVKQNVIGVLLIEDTAADRFHHEELSLVESLAATASISIENAKLYEQARRDSDVNSTLLHEVNHRVKNNLSAIIGLLYAERHHVGMENQAMYQSVVQDLVNRVQGLATVHSLLSASQWAPLLLSDLTSQIIRSSLQMLPGHTRVSVDVVPSPVQVTANQAHHLALVINELTSNSIKHAPRDCDAVHIAVHIDREDEMVLFEFRDDGPGYPDDVLRLERYSVGFDLIKKIVQKNLNGVVTVLNDQGAVTTIRFNAETEKRDHEL